MPPVAQGKEKCSFRFLLFIYHRALDKSLTFQNFNSYIYRGADEQYFNNVARINNQNAFYMCRIPFLDII